MADRANELMAEKESAALKQLQAAAGLIEKSHAAERVDWMYEQSVSQKQDDDALMNMPVAAQKDKDIEDMKKLGENTAGSLFLKSATKTSEDVLRKLREDPLFQIRRQEQAARESALSNPLILAKLKQKELKRNKKEAKKAKKLAKKEKKAMKKAAKKEKKAMKKKSSSSSSSSDSSAPGDAAPHRVAERQAASPVRRAPREAPVERRHQSPPRRGDDAALGPSSHMVGKREEYAARVADQKSKALASRGAPRRMDEEEKRRRLEQMQADASRHEKIKDDRIAEAHRKEKIQEELEARMRNTSDQQYFKDMRRDAYMGSNDSVADRLKNQRARRQKHLNDPLERDG